MNEQEKYPIRAQNIIDAVNRCLPLINNEAAKERFLRIYYLLLMLRQAISR